MDSQNRDLPEDRGGEYPAHVTVRDFQFDGTDLAVSLWLGNENSASEVDVMLTEADTEWLITALQAALDATRRTRKP